MILTKTPFRMSFFGGGTDIEDFFKDGRGAVISTTFDKYAYVTVRHLPRFFEYSSEIIYSQMERVKTLEEIDHPMIRNAMKMMDVSELRITYDADLPARTGLGTSSTFAVGLLNALYALKGKFASKQQLANDAIYLERTLCKEDGGWQDQIAASFGGFNRIDFDANGYHLNPIVMSASRKKKLNDNLLLFFTSFTRNSSDIQRESRKSIPERSKQLHRMLELVDEAQVILENNDRNLDHFGLLLDEEWSIKKQMSDFISNDKIDELYQKGKDAGALGGKLLGAGGGGFLLFYVPKNHQAKVREALKDLMEVPFQFEDNGTKVIYYTPEVIEPVIKE